MNIIFLDVDGVLNSYQYCDKTKKSIDKERIKVLKKIVDEFHAEIVLSSTWKQCNHPECPDMYAMYTKLTDALGEYGLKIYDQTPETLSGDRPLEIKMWLESHNYVENWVSIEDDWHEKHYKAKGIPGHLVQTYYWTDIYEDGGLQEKHIEEVRKIFKETKWTSKRQ